MASSADVAFINPAVLRWALDKSAISRQLVANKLHVDEANLEAWASSKSTAHPPFKKAQELATLLRIPFGYFYLPEPPKVELPLPDFRGVSASYVPSPEFVELLNDVLLRRDWYGDYAKDAGLPKLSFIGSLETSDGVTDVAASIRKTLGVTLALRQSASTWSEFLSKLSSNAEAAGILVMRSSVVGQGSSTTSSVTLRSLKSMNGT